MNQKQHKKFLSRTDLLSQIIQSHELEILELLSMYETYGCAKDEVGRSLKTLAGMEDEVASQAELGQNFQMATFLPLNLPLYSLILFAVAPAVHMSKIYVRPPKITIEVINKLSDLLKLPDIFPEIVIKDVSRSTFLRIYAKNSEVVVFTGKYSNALRVRSVCRYSLFIYNGSGVNPMIVFSNADIDLSTKKIYEMRTFNSGQDCAGPDAIFVHKNIVGNFLDSLASHLDTASLGAYGDRATNIGPISRVEYVADVVNYLSRHKDKIFRSGQVISSKHLVSPYILCHEFGIGINSYHEFFAPIFNIIVFKNLSQLKGAFAEKFMRDHSMYISYFGSSSFMQKLRDQATLLHNEIINDVEEGNRPYGGYGEKANYIAFGSKHVVRPILINQEIFNFYSTKRLA